MESKEPEGVGNKSRKAKLKYNPNYRLIKRTKPKLPQSNIHVYINRKTNIQHQINKCRKILESGEDTVVIHGLGAAISTAINVALILGEQSTIPLNIQAMTSTVNEIHDFVPLTDDLEPFSTKKQSSAIHICINRFSKDCLIDVL